MEGKGSFIGRQEKESKSRNYLCEESWSCDRCDSRDLPREAQAGNTCLYISHTQRLLAKGS